MQKRITRLNLDYTAPSTQDAAFDVTLEEPIVENAEDYNMSVEKAEVSLKEIPIISMLRPYRVRILIPSVFLQIIAGTGLVTGYNEFTIARQEIYSIQDFIDKLNALIYDKSINADDDHLGKFDYINGKIRFTMTNNEYIVNLHNEYARVWVDDEIAFLTDSIPHLYTDLSNGLHEIKYKEFLDNLDFGPPPLDYAEQSLNLITRFYQFKSIRIFSTLPTQKFFIFDQESHSLSQSNLLQEFVMNSEQYEEGAGNLIYIPTLHKSIELVSNQDIKSFNLSFMIHFKNGKDIQLKLQKNEYLSVTLAFEKI